MVLDYSKMVLKFQKMPKMTYKVSKVLLHFNLKVWVNSGSFRTVCVRYLLIPIGSLSTGDSGKHSFIQFQFIQKTNGQKWQTHWIIYFMAENQWCSKSFILIIIADGIGRPPKHFWNLHKSLISVFEEGLKLLTDWLCLLICRWL